MRPKEIVSAWVDAFNRADVDSLVGFYSETAVNHQVAENPVEGREAIWAMFVKGFATARMVCIVENLFEDGDWAILEWRDPLGLRGCGFFHVVNDTIIFQRGYWDKPSFLRLHGSVQQCRASDATQNALLTQWNSSERVVQDECGSVVAKWNGLSRREASVSGPLLARLPAPCTWSTVPRVRTQRTVHRLEQFSLSPSGITRALVRAERQ